MQKFLLAGLLLFSFNVQAKHHDGGACKSDREKFCKDVKAGHGDIMKCMKEHEAELSAECKAQHAEHKQMAKDIRQACKADREKLCAGKKGREVMKCMKENESQLSAECKAEVEQMKSHKKSK